MDWTNEQELRHTGCIYRYRGVICKDKTKCDNSGWNPRVEEKRKEIVRERYKEVLHGLGSV